VSVPFLQKITKIPVIGVIEPGSKAAVQNSNSQKIGIIGTMGTVKSGAYQKQIKKLNPKAKIFHQACSLFVQLAEDGWTDNKVSLMVADTYLSGLKKSGIDSLIMGCTHYPILKKTIAKTMGRGIKLIDPGEETAACVKQTLEEMSLINKQPKKGSHKFFVTDFPNNFKEISERFLGQKIKEVKKIKLH
jgi:glutamate racemase